MPELPEVETMRRGILGVRGARIARVAFPRRQRLRPLTVRPSRAAFSRRLRGRRIAELERLGKRVVLVLDSEDRVVFEPRMTGLVLIDEPPSQEHLRARLLLEDVEVPELRFWDRRGLGVLSVFSPTELAAELGPDRLGPDALGLDAPTLRERLAASSRAIKVALLDQRALAGVGNIYASECLHVARILPTRPCQSLSPREWRRLATALGEVLEEAIRLEGSTLGDGTYRNALNRAGSYQNHHRVYQREGDPCPRCGDVEVERSVLAQRATFFCTGCQR